MNRVIVPIVSLVTIGTLISGNLYWSNNLQATAQQAKQALNKDASNTFHVNANANITSVTNKDYYTLKQEEKIEQQIASSKQENKPKQQATSSKQDEEQDKEPVSFNQVKKLDKEPAYSKQIEKLNKEPVALLNQAKKLNKKPTSPEQDKED